MAVRPSRFVRTALFVALSVLAISAALADDPYWFAVDVPTTLGGVTYTPNQVIRNWNNAYTVFTTLDPTVAIGALQLRPDGTVLFAPRAPFTNGSTTYEPRDVVAFLGASYSYVVAGSAAGIPADARIDGIMLDPNGNLVLSFDAPVTLGGTTYGPNDLVVYANGAFSLFWSASAAALPPDTNVIGIGRDPVGDDLFAFDVPTRLGSADYLPGQLVRWDGATSFGLQAGDPAWPLSSEMTDFTFAPGAPTVPDGRYPRGTEMTVRKGIGPQITLAWAASCAGTETDYAVYEGKLGQYYSHTSRLCSTAGQTTASLTPGPQNAYYLVVARNAVAEGSPGRDSSYAERPQGTNACAPMQSVDTCY